MKSYIYRASGFVYGKCWGGGLGAYPAEKVSAGNLKDLRIKIEEGIKDGSLDSGMGYESLTGAFMVIETIRSIVKNGREYVNSSFKRAYFGNLSKSDKWFLSRCRV